MLKKDSFCFGPKLSITQGVRAWRALSAVKVWVCSIVVVSNESNRHFSRFCRKKEKKRMNCLFWDQAVPLIYPMTNSKLLDSIAETQDLHAYKSHESKLFSVEIKKSIFWKKVKSKNAIWWRGLHVISSSDWAENFRPYLTGCPLQHIKTNQPILRCHSIVDVR